MTIEFQNDALEVKAERSGKRVFVLMVLYLVLAVTVGVVHNPLQSAYPTSVRQTLASQAGVAHASDRLN